MLGAAEMRIRAKASRMSCKARQMGVLEGLGAARAKSERDWASNQNPKGRGTREVRPKSKRVRMGHLEAQSQE